MTLKVPLREYKLHYVLSSVIGSGSIISPIASRSPIMFRLTWEKVYR